MRSLGILTVSLAISLPDLRAAMIETHSYVGGSLAIDDGNPSGLASTLEAEARDSTTEQQAGDRTS